MKPRAITTDKPAGQIEGGDDGDLLAEDGPDRHSNPSQAPGHAQPGPLSDQRRQQGILR